MYSTSSAGYDEVDLFDAYAINKNEFRRSYNYIGTSL